MRSSLARGNSSGFSSNSRRSHSADESADQPSSVDFARHTATLDRGMSLCVVTAMRRSVLIIVFAGRAAADPKPAVFDYSASNGEFGYSITLRADRTWSRVEHSGGAAPSGKLSQKAMKRFGELLATARFKETPATCDHLSKERAWYRDPIRRRDARYECGRAVDEATARLPGCLEMLIAGATADQRIARLGRADEARVRDRRPRLRHLRRRHAHPRRAPRRRRQPRHPPAPRPRDPATRSVRTRATCSVVRRRVIDPLPIPSRMIGHLRPRPELEPSIVTLLTLRATAIHPRIRPVDAAFGAANAAWAWREPNWLTKGVQGV